MDSLVASREFAHEGKFAEALKRLDASSINRSQQFEAEVLRADLLEQVGRHGESRALVQRLLKSKQLTATDHSICESVLGRIEGEEGSTSSAIVHLQRALSFAIEAKDLRLTCWSQLRLFIALANGSGPNSATPLLAELRANAIKLGDPQISAALHIYVGETEAKRGFLKRALWHTRMGQQLLSAAPNVWLEATAENAQICIAVLRSDAHAGMKHAHEGLGLSEQSGRAAGRRALLGNLGNVLFLLGRFDEAVDYFNGAIATLPSAGENCNANLDSLARVRLTQGLTEECGRILDRIDESIQTPNDKALFAHRYAQLTRVQLLERQEQFEQAFEGMKSVESLANRSADRLLCYMALLTKAELLQQSGRHSEWNATLDLIVQNLSNSSPDLHAHYERILACALAADGDTYAAQPHFDRAKRIYDSLGHVPGLLELNRRWERATSQASHTAPGPGAATRHADDQAARARTALQAAAALMLHAGRPELLACEIVELLAVTGCVRGAAAISRDADGQVQTLAVSGEPPSADAPPQAAKRIAIGTARERAVEVLAASKPDIESVATLNAVSLLISTIHDLECARAEREERLTLWPIDDVPLDGGGQAVVAGQMRELMSFARRIANTSVSVLITGESGTGKEILARAIHTFSQRAQKPFVPFNCTAIPRELLESQLFGYRRGSFTGADRDNPGLIRSAREGTLFLDEIGELGLDLQPKLLRFLESGEISPLGEPALTVDVRVIAATNSDLEQLVKEGRFREDLFYRLNVIRLRIPPLRERRDEIPGLVNYFVGRAAREFDKGQVRLAEETMEYLLLYPWPGNVRQLNNELRRMVALAERDTVLTPPHLSEAILREKRALARPINGSEIAVPLHDKLGPTLSRIEREMIKAALHEHHGKVDAAAHALGISRKGLYLKRQRLGL